jgi:hypothetical protein
MKKITIHHPRSGLAEHALCGVQNHAGYEEQHDISNKYFFVTSKSERCKRCEKLLRAQGGDVNSWIIEAGGTL